MLNEFNNTVMKPAKEIEIKIEDSTKGLAELEFKVRNSNFLIRDIVKKLIYAMETSLVSGKTVSQLAKDQSKLSHNDSAMIINNKSSKPRFDTPDRTRDAYENIFLKRLAFLKNLLTDGNPNTNTNNENGMNSNQVNS